LDTDTRQLAKDLVGRPTGRALPPSLANGQPVANVERDDDPVRAVGLDQPPHETRFSESDGSDDDPPRARVQGSGDVSLGPKTTRDLDGDPLPHLSDQPRNRVGLDWPAFASAFQIDDVDGLCPLRREAPRDLDGILREGRRVIEDALPQSDDLVPDEIDRRQNLECCVARFIMVAF
jgi:hypothetical protein